MTRIKKNAKWTSFGKIFKFNADWRASKMVFKGWSFPPDDLIIQICNLVDDLLGRLPHLESGLQSVDKRLGNFEDEKQKTAIEDMKKRLEMLTKRQVTFDKYRWHMKDDIAEKDNDRVSMKDIEGMVTWNALRDVVLEGLAPPSVGSV